MRRKSLSESQIWREKERGEGEQLVIEVVMEVRGGRARARRVPSRNRDGEGQRKRRKRGQDRWIREREREKGKEKVGQCLVFSGHTSETQVRIRPSLASNQKNNTFLFCEDEKHTENFARINSEHFDIYKNKKYILALFLLLKKKKREMLLTFSLTHSFIHTFSYVLKCIQLKNKFHKILNLPSVMVGIGMSGIICHTLWLGLLRKWSKELSTHFQFDSGNWYDFFCEDSWIIVRLGQV